MLRRRCFSLAALGAVLLLASCGGHAASGSWTSANGGAASQRAATTTDLDARTISQLKVRWRFSLRATGTGFGAITSNPIIRGDEVYLQDSNSSVYALDVRSGSLLWKDTIKAPNDGPNGLSVSGSRLYGATDTTAFAIDATSGKRLWSRRLVGPFEQFIAIAPVVDRGRVYVSTQGFVPGGRGVLYALSAETGKIIWRFRTIKLPWAYPRSSGGGGAWNPVSVDEHGNVYAGISNPGPVGWVEGVPERRRVPRACALHRFARRARRSVGPAALVRPGDAPRRPRLRLPGLTDSRHGRRSPRRLRRRQGRAGRRLGSRRTHAPLVSASWPPSERSRIAARATDDGLSGLLGGVLTPMAYAAGRLFVPVVELCSRESAVTSKNAFARPPSQGKGTVYALDAATGKTVWQVQLASAPFGCATVARDAVIVPTYDGHVVAFAAADGRTLWRHGCGPATTAVRRSAKTF